MSRIFLQGQMLLNSNIKRKYTLELTTITATNSSDNLSNLEGGYTSWAVKNNSMMSHSQVNTCTWIGEEAHLYRNESRLEQNSKASRITSQFANKTFYNN